MAHHDSNPTTRRERDRESSDMSMSGLSVDIRRQRLWQWLYHDVSPPKEQSSPALEPLRPPLHRANIRYEPSPSRVTVETPFSELEESPFGHTAVHDVDTVPEPLPEEVASPITRLSAFSYIRQRWTCLRQRSILSRPTATKSSPVIAGINLKGHSSSLQRKSTLEELNQVSRVLKAFNRTSFKTPVRIPTGMMDPDPAMLQQNSRTTTTGNLSISNEASRFPRFVRGIMRQETMNGRKIFEPQSRKASYTSSLRRLRMGVVPRNSPNERATYKVKRSPSQESETYLKIDISIRGGTSFLPSEARRIHTPPLPEVRRNGKLRGFFFDYNAPRSFSEEANVHRTAAVASETKQVNTDLGLNNPPRDWYDVHLDNLSIEDMTRAFHPHNGSEDYAPPLRRIDWMIAEDDENDESKEVEDFDETIPEHLPSSALCPRHPKYWRVVQGKGSQFRGCWMHGVGVYKPGERVRTRY